jgi:spore germination cell wall hydrolase CwlJ-like protein
MALTIWGEARGEKRPGKIGVGSVILERVDHRSWDGTTINEVCLWPVQFSCFLPKDPNRPKLIAIATNWDSEFEKDVALRECYEVAKGLIEKTIPRYPEALQYINPKAVAQLPDWYFTMKKVAVIGRHEFFA